MTVFPRRTFLKTASAAGLGLAASPLVLGAEQLLVTPTQTAGPFYPVPKIADQKFNDTDLTRKMGDDEVAKGEVIVVDGRVLDVKGEPVNNALVEIWQACTSGKYNHSRDDNKAALDDNFQFWGRMMTDDEGKYKFRTIKPGAYPGRTPHIHFHVLAQGYRQLVTQSYFAAEAAANAKDFIYRSLEKKERDAVTVEFAKCDEEKALKGSFDVVLNKS